jgi:translocation and assembly module TamB
MRRILLATLVAAVLVIVAVGWLLVRGDLTESVRSRLVREATQSLGRDVTVLRLGGDPVRGIVLEGVRVANPDQPPRGSFFEAPRVVVRFDIGRLTRDLFTGRGIAQSVIAIEVDRPFLVLSRDVKGRWNYSDLFERDDAAAEVPSFRGAVRVREGTLVFSDALAIQSPFGAHFERITGLIDFSDAPRVRISADAINTDGDTPALLRAAGVATIGEGTFDLDVTTRGASSEFWGPYLLKLPWLAWRGGTFDGTIHLLASHWIDRIALDYQGRLLLRAARAELLPQRTTLSEINGPLLVDNTGVSTEGLRMAVGSASPRGPISPIWVRGTITHVAGAHFDLAVRSPALNLATLQRLVFPRAAVRLEGQANGDARIVGSLVSPRIEGRIDAAYGRLNREGFTNASGDFSYYGGLLIFDRMSLAAGSGQMAGHFRLDPGDRTFFALAQMRNLDTRILPGFGLVLDPSLRGYATGALATAGTRAGTVAQGRIQMGRGVALGMGFDRLETLFDYARGRVEIDRLYAQSGSSTMHAYGVIGRTGTLAMKVAADEVSLRTVSERFRLKGALSGRADFVGELRGTTRAPVLSADMAVRNGTLGPFPFDRAFGRVHVTPTGVSTPGLRLRDGPGIYELAGSIAWTGRGAFDLRLTADRLPAQRWLDIADVPLDLQGTIRGDLHLTGPLNQPYASGTVELHDGRIEGQRVDRARAEFRWTGTHLLLDRAEASVNASTIQAQGSVSREGALRISFAAQGFHLRDIGALRTEVVDVDGMVDLTGTIGATLRAPAVDAAIASTSLVVNGQRFDRASGRVQLQGSRLTFNPLELHQGGGTFALRGSVQLNRNPAADLRITATGAEMSGLLSLFRVRPPVPLSGTLDGEFSVSGPLSTPRVTVNASLQDGKLGDHTIRDAVVEATYADQAVTLRRLVVHPQQGELVGAGRIDLEGESEVELAGTGLNLDLLRPLLRVQRPLAGALDFTLQLSGRLAEPLVGLSATVTDGTIGSASFDRLILQAFYRDGQFQISPAVLQEGQQKARLEGNVPFNPARFRFDETRPMDLRLSLVDADLSVLGLLTDAVQEAKGPLAGEVRITGTVSQPRMEGSISTSDASIKVRRVEPALTGLAATVTFDANEVRIGQFTARMGEGTVSGAGALGIRNFRPDRLALQLTADGARLKYDPHFAGRIDGSLRIEGTATRPLVGGSLVVSQGDMFVGAPRGPGVTATAGLNPTLDVDLRAGEQLWVNVGDLRFEVHGAVHAGGTWRDPKLSGEVEAARGNFTAFDTTFTLTEGRATFSEARGLTPFVDATAETRVRTQVTRTVQTPAGSLPETRTETVTIFVHVQGTPDNLTAEYSSDPTLPQNEILALLAGQARLVQVLRGQPIEEALRAELSEALFGPIGRQVAKALGLEEFQIEYDLFSASTVRPLRLRIGKLLISNLYVTMTSEFGEVPRHVWSLEYRFTPNTQVSFSIDNESQLNLFYVVTYRF